jgi:uncharacterized protein (TIGR02466 family)
MIHIDNWFPTTVAYSDLNCIENIAEYQQIAEKIITEVEHDPHPFGESKLGTTFWHPIHGHLDKDDRFEKITNHIKKQSLEFLKVLGYGELPIEKLKFLNMWINFIGPNDYHALHIHNSIGQALISGVYYIDAPQSAQLSFGSPYRDTHIPVKPMFDTYENYSKVSYDCVPGRIVMFRSNTYHGYDAHGSDHLKLSMPFNIAIDNTMY